jgi:hypothetical protein
MFVLFPERPVRRQGLRMLEVYRESVTTDRGIERLVGEIELEPEPVAIVRRRTIEIVDEELRGDPGDPRSTSICS